MKINVVDGDLLKQNVDVIVNPWNRNFIPWWLLLPKGVSGAIKHSGGYEPFRELSKAGTLPLGGAVLTTAGKLPYKGIIHVAGLHAYWTSSEKSIRLSVRNAIELAVEHEFESIALPLIGAGTGGKNEEKALAIIQDELNNLPDYNLNVSIVRYRKIAQDAGESKRRAPADTTTAEPLQDKVKTERPEPRQQPEDEKPHPRKKRDGGGEKQGYGR